jgi:hypothetical protein
MTSGRAGASLIAAIIALCIVVPTVTAHRADTIWVIARDTHLYPETLDVMLNDSIEVHNVADSNRTVRIDFDGDGLYNGSNDVDCSLANGEYCTIWLEPANWTGGQWSIEVIDENGSRMNGSLTVLVDTHEGDDGHDEHESGSEDEDPQVESESSTTLKESLPLIALASGLGGFILLILSIPKDMQRDEQE